jgi:thymidylate synthase
MYLSERASGMTTAVIPEQNLKDLICFKDLIIGNPHSNVGICTLWTQRHLIAERLNPQDFFICANLYSFAGINYMLRNILQFPQIRYLIVCGADQSQSGEALEYLFNKGVEGGRYVPDKSLSLEAIEQIRHNVQLVDLRPTVTGLKSIEAITKHIKNLLPNLAKLAPFAEPQTYPEAIPSGGKPLSSEISGFRVEGRTVAETWLELMKMVMRFGQIKPTEYSQKQRELLNTVAVVTEEDPDDLFFAPYLPFSREDLDAYYPQVLSAIKPEGVSYTYGERLRKFGDNQIDQVERMKLRLRETLNTRRATAVTWLAEVDTVSTNPPCLLEVSAAVQSDKLHLTARFRSHDIYTAWVQNTFALRRLQKEIADSVNLPLGTITIISHSAHIYEDKWDFALDTVLSFENKKWEWKSDPRGYFVITLENNLIKAQHATLDGFTPYLFEGSSARQICLQIAREKLASLDEHYAYIGRELMKAEIALKLGINYTQDKELEWHD